MVVSRDKAPSAQETFMQMAQAAGLRSRLLVTIGLLILCRLGIAIPVPGIDRVRLAQDLPNIPGLNFLDYLAGGGLSTVGIFALGILPYINASIILQLLTPALPSLENLQKNEGEAGRRRISQITRYITLGWAIIQSVGFTYGLLRNYAIGGQGNLLFVAETSLALVAGSMFVMWVSELITERGIGNGASLLIFINIVAVLPSSLNSTIQLAQKADRQTLGGIILLLIVFLLMIIGIVFVQEASRRIPIVSARRQVGRKVFRERSSYLPLRLNQGGVMPIIFASSMLVLPSSLIQFIPADTKDNPILEQIRLALISFTNALSPRGGVPWVYVLVFFILIIFFSYFYSTLVINPVDVSQNLKKVGSSIPGIRPGRATSEYLERVLNRLTFLGAVFLGLVAIIPTIVETFTGITTFSGFGATSLLIVVGVAIDTAKQIQTYVISQRYEGMIKT